MSMASLVDLACGLPDGPRAPVLLVMLPGAYDTPADFVQQGFVAALRARQLAVDVQLVNAHVSYYMQQTIVDQLRQTVIQPALQAGYREIWLAGISIGGMGSLMYSATHPSDISGVVALAPYLGSRHISVQAERAGGLHHWPREGFPLPEDESDRRLWLWLKARAEQGDAGQPLFWGYGERDRFAHGHKLVAQALRAERVAVVDGAHDWPTWAALWQLMLERLPWPVRPDAVAKPQATQPDQGMM